MCDKTTLERWAKDKLSRREFGVVTGAAALAACSELDDVGVGPVKTDDGRLLVVSDAVSFETEDGTMDGILFAPLTGQYPAVIHWPDIAGIRPSHIAMADRTAAEGYAVLLVNPYYRDVKGQIWDSFAQFADGGWERASEMRGKLSSFAVKRDAKAIVEFLDAHPSVDTKRGIGAEGYCMGGPFTVYSAHAVPGRVKAAASFHGGGLVREDDESPHKLMAETVAQYLIGIATNDDAKAPGDKTALREAADAAGKQAVIEVFTGDHGWTVPDSPAYAKDAAEEAWAAKLQLYRAAL